MKNSVTVFEYENISSFDEDNNEETKNGDRERTRKVEKGALEEIVARDQFPESDREEDDEHEGSEGIDEGFLQIASAGSINTGSLNDETTR